LRKFARAVFAIAAAAAEAAAKAEHEAWTSADSSPTRDGDVPKEAA
jgi:hypothetical protein